jgi:hypothetical protein
MKADQWQPLHLLASIAERRGWAMASVTPKARIGERAAYRGVELLIEASMPTVKLPMAVAGPPRRWPGV